MLSVQGVGEYLQRIIKHGLPGVRPGTDPFHVSAMEWDADVFHDASSEMVATPLPDSGMLLVGFTARR